jgi:hypothetical protein
MRPVHCVPHSLSIGGRDRTIDTGRVLFVDASASVKLVFSLVDKIAYDWSMAASSDRTDGLQSSPYMHHMQPSGGGQMGGMPPAYFDHAQQQQYSMGPHSAPPMPKQHMSFPYPPSSHDRLMSMPSTSGQTGAPPSYYATGRTPSLVSRTTSGQPRMQQLMGPPVPRKQQVYVFSTDLGNK